jgi:hypothetical protein
MKKDGKGKKGNSHIFDLQVAKELIIFVGEHRDNQDSAMKSLEIAKRLKDVYLSAFNSRFQSPNTDLPVADELSPLQEQTTLEFLELIKNNGSSASAESSSQTWKTSQEQSNVKAEGNVELVCFYCSATNVEQTEDSFFIHPYVPVNYERSPLLMCVHCLENWKVFREEASQVNELILPGENNEEICCLCSDCPKKLTLCCSCQRSFCLNCLKKVLTPAEYKTMIAEKGKENDWKCMCCSNQTSVHPPLGRDAWRLWNSPPDKSTVASSSSTGKKSPTKQSKNSKNNIPTPQKASSVVESSSPSVASAARKRKAGSQSSETPVKDESTNSVNSSSKQKKRRKNEDEESEEKDVENSNKQKDSTNKNKNEKLDQSEACFYFQDYCLDLNQSYKTIIQSLNNHSSTSEEELTEDVCFLCKDGGNLVGCDYCSPSAASSESIEPNQRCSKVYHQDCLGFKIPRGVSYWCCPKHFCSSCGGKELQFMCLFCPISLCKECPSKLPQKVS